MTGVEILAVMTLMSVFFNWYGTREAIEIHRLADKTADQMEHVATRADADVVFLDRELRRPDLTDAQRVKLQIERRVKYGLSLEYQAKADYIREHADEMRDRKMLKEAIMLPLNLLSGGAPQWAQHAWAHATAIQGLREGLRSGSAREMERYARTLAGETGVGYKERTFIEWAIGWRKFSRVREIVAEERLTASDKDISHQVCQVLERIRTDRDWWGERFTFEDGLSKVKIYLEHIRKESRIFAEISAVSKERKITSGGFDAMEGTAPLEVAFDSAGSWAGEDEIMSYQWDFENGEPSSSQESSARVTYREPGNYRAYLTIWDNRGYSDSRFVEILVHPFLGIQIVNVAATPQEVNPGKEVNFYVKYEVGGLGEWESTKIAEKAGVPRLGLKHEKPRWNVYNGPKSFKGTFKVPEDAEPGDHKLTAKVSGKIKDQLWEDTAESSFRVKSTVAPAEEPTPIEWYVFGIEWRGKEGKCECHRRRYRAPDVTGVGGFYLDQTPEERIRRYNTWQEQQGSSRYMTGPYACFNTSKEANDFVEQDLKTGPHGGEGIFHKKMWAHFYGPCK